MLSIGACDRAESRVALNGGSSGTNRMRLGTGRVATDYEIRFGFVTAIPADDSAALRKNARVVHQPQASR